jgi:hypothetical protein
MSADPAGPVDGVNLYQYVSGNPVRKSDPQGTDEWDMTDPAPVGQSSNADATENTVQTCDPDQNEEWDPNGQSDEHEELETMVNDEEGFTLNWRGGEEELERAEEEIHTKHIYTKKTEKGVELHSIDKSELARRRDIIQSDVPIESVPSPIDFMTGGVGSLTARGLIRLGGKLVLRGGRAVASRVAGMSKAPTPRGNIGSPNVSGALPSASSREGVKGYVSGFREIMAKARAAKAGDGASAAEIRAAKYLSSQGKNVHFQTPGSVRSGAGGTADFLVGGARGTGAGGTPYDVLSPTTPNPNAVFRAIRNKNNQAQGIIVDLSRTRVTPADLGNVMNRLKGAGAKNIQNVIFLP